MIDMVFPFFTHEEYAIEGFVGMNGSGKTAYAVADAIQRTDRTKNLLYSNIRIDHPAYRPLTSIAQFSDIHHCHILLDEVNAIFPSRNTLGLPQEMQLLISSLRHKDITLAWTSPSPSHADINLRRVSQTITSSKAVLQVYGDGASWPNTKWSFFNQYDIRQATNEDEDLTFFPVIRRGFLRLKSLPLSAYDTHESVDVLNDHLICSECGGFLKKKYCSGSHKKIEKDITFTKANPFDL